MVLKIDTKAITTKMFDIFAEEFPKKLEGFNRLNSTDEKINYIKQIVIPNVEMFQIEVLSALCAQDPRELDASNLSKKIEDFGLAFEEKNVLILSSMARDTRKTLEFARRIFLLYLENDKSLSEEERQEFAYVQELKFNT